jgi:aminoglycoside phosphotransferase
MNNRKSRVLLQVKRQLPAELAAAVEGATGASIVRVERRGAGGASREGAELTLRYPDGRVICCFMNYDPSKAGFGSDFDFLREAAMLRALSGPLASSGVRTARFVAAIPSSRALIGEFVEGEVDFNKLTSAAEQLAVAKDFMAQMAALHAIDGAAADIPELGPVVPPSTAVRNRIASIRERIEIHRDDPLAWLCLDWLERSVPPDPPRISIVHGDAGPANFLYKDGRVAALLDWEFVGLGDPMADLAMIAIRNLFQPFVPLPEAFSAYEAAGGASIDLAKVRYYRILLLTALVSAQRLLDPVSPRCPNLGMNLIYETVQRRALVECLAEATNVALMPVARPDIPPTAIDGAFEVALEDLRDTIVPALDDRRAVAKAKGLARLVKWWRSTDRLRPVLAAEELADLAPLLGAQASLDDGRRALSAAIFDRRISHSDAMRLCHRQVAREALLLADAMGSLFERRLAPLEW